MTEEMLVTALVDSKKNTEIKCPYCGVTRRVNLGKYKDLKPEITTKCKCGKRFSIQFDYRSEGRVYFECLGQFMVLRPQQSALMGMSVFDLSKHGIGMEVEDAPPISPGDRLRVIFTLDLGPKPEEIDTEVLVKQVSGNYLGCEFVNFILDYEILEANPFF
ncbi:MAG: hypothetical protein D6B25_07470 [Desulfobulbaceae bacterium]|nr:MAG: hypothetical protein D6B25_07470 [Desulfobulbaceae bacterium]